MKFAIITTYNIPNYGAILQAYALYIYLRLRGHDAVFINSKYILPGKFSLVRLICSRSIKAFLSKIKMNRLLNASSDILGEFKLTRPYYSISELAQHPPRADVYFVGSDQVWNFGACRKKVIDQTMLLSFLPDSALRMAYAVSFGGTVLADIVDKSDIAQNMKKFAFISVREDSGRDIVKALTGKLPAWVCDPVLLHDANFWSTFAGTPKINHEGILFRYMLGWEDKVTLQNFEKLIIQTLTLSKIEDPQSEDGHPSSIKEWLLQLLGASAVITNSFHGTLFSILFKKNFITLTFRPPYQNRNTRVASLLRRLGLEDRMFDCFDSEKAFKVLNTPINWQNVNNNINEWKRQTDELFEEVEFYCRHHKLATQDCTLGADIR